MQQVKKTVLIPFEKYQRLLGEDKGHLLLEEPLNDNHSDKTSIDAEQLEREPEVSEEYNPNAKERGENLKNNGKSTISKNPPQNVADTATLKLPEGTSNTDNRNKNKNKRPRPPPGLPKKKKTKQIEPQKKKNKGAWLKY